MRYFLYLYLFIMMETQEQSHKDPSCNNCKNKQSLIHKYQNLIELLKRKADKAHLSMTQKISVGDRTTSNSSIHHFSKAQKHRLIMTLWLIFLQRQKSVFDALKMNQAQDQCRKAAKFFIILSNLQKNRQFQAFSSLKESSQKLYKIQIKNIKSEEQSDNLQNNHLTALKPVKNSQSYSQTAQQLIKSIIFTKDQQKKVSQHFKSLTNILTHDKVNLLEMNNPKKEITINNQSQIQNRSESFNNQSLLTFVSKQSMNTKQLYQKIFFLEQENYLYVQKIKKLQQEIQDAMLRQEKQNKKKKESLEMLAQEMGQKNQIIAELQENIQILEQKYNHYGNAVLEDELTSLKKEVDKFEKLNQKLDSQSERTKIRISQVQAQLKDKSQTIFKMQQEMRNVKQKNFQLNQRNQELIKLQQNCSKMHYMILKSLQKFKTFQKSFLSASKKNMIQEMSQIQNKHKNQEQNYKIELLLIYLYNIEDKNYQFPYVNIFDQEEFKVLKELKNKFLMLSVKNNKENCEIFQDQMQIKFKSKKIGNFNHGKSHQHVQNDEVYCHQNMMDGTIFSVLNTPRQNQLSGFNFSPSGNNTLKSQIQRNSGQGRHSHEKNMTMKLLQMQIQKNKQIQKISELKQKMMHIRNVILNLLKSLQIKTIKSQTQGILDVLFDVFEYSQQEKQQIFKQKQRGIFGFFN